MAIYLFLPRSTPLNHTPRYWFALHPDVKRPVGGVKQMHRLCEAVTAFGRDATIIQDSADFHPGWFNSDVRTISVNQFRSSIRLHPDRDIVILPETFINVFLDYCPGIPKIIFNQNGAYSFGRFPESGWPNHSEVIKLYHHPELLHVLCVSMRDRELLANGFGIGSSTVSHLSNPIEQEVFKPVSPKLRQIVYMPRKNYRDASIVLSMLQQQEWSRRWTIVPVTGLSQDVVASILGKSALFLSFGHPEGFGLPSAEALACGCILVGYSGLGGRELFELSALYGVSTEVDYQDWYGFIGAIRSFDFLLHNNPEALARSLSDCSHEIRRRYSLTKFRESVNRALVMFELAWRARFLNA